MFTAYFDESGDDGLQGSPLFVLTATYCHHSKWKENFSQLRLWRRQIRDAYGLPMKYELHTTPFILNKRPYTELCISDDDRAVIIDQFCDTIANLSLRIVNVVIHKSIIQLSNYNVLGKALTYSIQRVENDMRKKHSNANFIMITDSGRLGMMRKTARKMQAINYIPSMFTTTSYRRDIELLIEDPLPKDSVESYFIQISDAVSRIVYMYKLLEFGGKLGNRTPTCIDASRIENWLKKLSPSLNTEASRTEKYGIVCYPK